MANPAILMRRPLASEAEEITKMILRSKAALGYDAEFMNAVISDLTVQPKGWGDPMLAEIDGQIAGYIELHVTGEIGEIHHLFIAPDAQRLGLGSQLMGWALDTARKQGIAVVRFEVEPLSETFYHGLGATTVGGAPSARFPGRILPIVEMHL